VGLSVNRYFKQCGKCGGKIQVDTMEYPGEGGTWKHGEFVPAGPVHENVEEHLGSCTPRPSEEVVADNSNVPAPPEPVAKAEHHTSSHTGTSSHTRTHR